MSFLKCMPWKCWIIMLLYGLYGYKFNYSGISFPKGLYSQNAAWWFRLNVLMKCTDYIHCLYDSASILQLFLRSLQFWSVGFSIAMKVWNEWNSDCFLSIFEFCLQSLIPSGWLLMHYCQSIYVVRLSRNWLISSEGLNDD